jgi:hypothetical protein
MTQTNTEYPTLRTLGITTADNMTLSPETLNMPVTKTIEIDEATAYVLDGGEVILSGSAYTLWYESMDELRAGQPQLAL